MDTSLKLISDVVLERIEENQCGISLRSSALSLCKENLPKVLISSIACFNVVVNVVRSRRRGKVSC